MSHRRGILYLVPTPLGNLSDMSPRALETLGKVELIACEDTRTSGRLLQHFGIEKRLVAYHEFNERAQSSRLLTHLNRGESIAVITDAGSPGIADPAYRIVKEALDNSVEVVALPGPCAIIPALTASGLPTDRFFFEGFLPPKQTARRKRLEKLKDFEHSLVFYESPHRLAETLEDALFVFGDRQACVAREISKLHEEYVRGSLSHIIQTISAPRGEIVLVVAGQVHVRQKVNKYPQEQDSGNDIE